MIIKAIFKGKDGSLGYKNGQEYLLQVEQYDNSKMLRIEHPTKCVYSTLTSFLRNWENINLG